VRLSFPRRIVLAAPRAAAAALLTGLAGALLLGPGALSAGAQGQEPANFARPAASLFGMAELDPQKFLVVSAPIGSSSRSQLNIYEQVSGRRPCFAVASGSPAVVNPLLSTFDFTGICGRYIDANGYSVRVGDIDLATVYRLSVVNKDSDILLMALPTRPGAGPEMVVGRTLGSGTGFLKLELEPGWRLARRTFRGRSLGHVYLYRDSWPAVSESPAAAPLAKPAPNSRSAAPVTPGAAAAAKQVPASGSAGLGSKAVSAAVRGNSSVPPSAPPTVR
jgi:hypothetical protein